VSELERSSSIGSHSVTVFGFLPSSGLTGGRDCKYLPSQMGSSAGIQRACRRSGADEHLYLRRSR
jgi:hypothetical protein